MKHPSIRDVRSVILDAETVSAGITENGTTIYVPARSLGWPSFRQRVKAAWLVFTCRADAVTYPGQ
jgi:hypothetical protein